MQNWCFTCSIVDYNREIGLRNLSWLNAAAFVLVNDSNFIFLVQNYKFSSSWAPVFPRQRNFNNNSLI